MQPFLKVIICLILPGLARPTERSGIARLQTNINGKTCTANRIFSLEDVPSVSTCAYRCDQDVTCTSFFYSSTQSRCDGCSVNYWTTASLSEDLQDSVYYRYRCPSPNDWAINDYSCYQFIPTTGSVNYDQAKSICGSLAGYPVEVETYEEQLFLMGYLDATYDPEYGYVHYWMGLNKRNSLNGEYLWETTGNPPSFTNWYHENTNPSATCIWMSHTHNYTWIDEPCENTAHLNPLCEM